jgi:serine/threonine protein kinase
MPAPDTVLQGRYRIVRQLGRGGMGAVYEAVDERLSRTVALKETLAETDDLKRAFEREARLLANLRHPVLPKVIDHFTEESGQFLVMEFIPGSDLGELLERRSRPFSPDEVLRWADDLLDALDHLHTNDPPIVHRDIKPSNLKLTAKGKIILLDFGLAKGFAGQMTRTSSGMSVVGYTLHYAALEQIQGERTGPRSDLYSLAATLYQLLTGHIPVDALKRAADLLNDMEDPLPSIRSLNPDVPDRFASILMEALSLKPSLRPASAAEMRAALQAGSPAFAHVMPVGDDEITKVSVSPGVAGRLPPIAIGGEKTMVLDSSRAGPLVPDGSGTLEHAYEADEQSNAKKWWLIAGGACLTVILIVSIFLLASRSNQTTVTPPTAPTAYDSVPPPFRDALPSVVALSMQDGEGKALRQVSGFFFKTDEIATSLSAIEGATQGRATFVGQSGTYEVTGVTGMDREHGLVTLKVARGKAPALAIGDKKQTTMGDRVAIVGSGAKSEPAYAPGAISGYLDNDRMEIGAQAGQSVIGGPLLNAQGEVIGIVTDSTGGRGVVAVPVNYLADLIRRKGQLMTLALAGAKDVLYDWRKAEGFKPATIDKDSEKRIIEAVARVHREKPPVPAPGPSPQGSPQVAESPGEPPWLKPDEMDNAIITGASTGSFTAAGLQQTAYLIDTRTGSHADNSGLKYLAIFNGETYVADFPVTNLSLILQTYDLNRDGINELLLGYSSTQMGEIQEWGKLVQVSQGKLRVIHDFGTTYRSTCGSESTSDKGIDSSVIFYAPPASNNQMPDFRVDNYRAACPAEGTEVAQEQWKYTSTGKLPDK